MAEKEEKQPSFLEKTLLAGHLMDVIGANALGTSDKFYDPVMQSTGVTAVRNQIYQQKVQNGKALGIAEKPPYPVNFDVIEDTTIQINEQFKKGNLGELYEIFQKIGAKIDVKLPNKIKGMSLDKIAEKAKGKDGKFDEKKLTEDEKIAMELQNYFSEAYVDFCRASVIQKYANTGLNSYLRAVDEHYNPKPKESAEKSE